MTRPAHRRARPSLVALVVTGVAVAAALAAGLVAWSAPAHSSLITLGWLPGRSLLVAVIALVAAAELVAVPLHRAEAVEELTLLDPMVMLAVLLLPPAEALAATQAGLLIAYGIRRRAPLKVLFNLSTYALAQAVMAGLLLLATGGTGTVGLQLVGAMALGAAGFIAVNLWCLALLFRTLGTGRLLDLFREDLKAAGFTLVASVALSATVVVLALHAPVLLPVAVLPAAAITFAYRSTATEVEERRRSARILAFSQALASSPDRESAIQAFLRVAEEGFAAAEVLLVFAEADDDAEGPPAGPDRRDLLRQAAGGPALLTGGLPAGWTSAALAPLTAAGSQAGAVLVGRRGRTPLRDRDLNVLAPLVSALGAALHSADNLARLVAETGKLRAVLDQSSDGILVLDGDGTVQLWNRALERLSGCPADAAVGTYLGDLLDTRDDTDSEVDAFLAGRRALTPASPQSTVDLQLRRPDGEHRSVRCLHAGIFDRDRLVRTVVNVHDVTRERQVDRLKSDFVATVSHELRTPVTPIKGYADLLRRKGDSLPPEKRAKAIEVIADRAAHLARLVEDLLLASNVSDASGPAPSVNLETADLTALVPRALEDFASAAGRLRTALPPGPLEVACDPVRVIQVLTNLVSNAVKYSPADTPIEVEAFRRDGIACVTVRDHGRGLPADQLEKIFEKFHRVEDPMVMSTGGTGLGLYIARHLARAMDGDLVVASTLGQGCTFTVSLPVAAEPQRPPTAGQPARPSGRAG